MGSGCQPGAFLRYIEGMPKPKKRCYCRFYNQIFLLTCLQPKGHDGDHKDEDSGQTWTNVEGFWDQYGD
jgi:hypothetical protein